MISLGLCGFVVWLSFVIAVGVTFLVWAWKQGEFGIGASFSDSQSQDREPDTAPRGTEINRNGRLSRTRREVAGEGKNKKDGGLVNSW
jgi:hypothetical protein